MNAARNDRKSEIQRTDLSALGEALSLWFAIASPSTRLMIGVLGAWFFTWLTLPLPPRLVGCLEQVFFAYLKVAI